MPPGGLIVPPPPSRYQEPLEADGGDEAAVSRRPECENCGATALSNGDPTNDEPPRPLLRCSRCRAAWFCSRACQRASWPFHRAHCRRNDFADAAEARGELKFAAFLRGHGRLAQLRDAEVERLEAASAPPPGSGGGGGGGVGGVGRGSWRGMSREEVMDSMYGRALPLPRAPTWGEEEGGGVGRSAVVAAASPSSPSGPPDLSAWAKAAEFEVVPGMGVAGASYAWTQSLSHVEAALRLPRACAEARRRRAAERWRLKAAAVAEAEEGEGETEGDDENRLPQPRLGGLGGRDVRVDLTATTLRVAIVDGRGRGVVAAAAEGAAAPDSGADDDEVLLCGELEAAVKASECTWYIDDDAGVVRLSLLKRCRRGHYDAVAPTASAAGPKGDSEGGAAAGATTARPRTNADTFWRGLLRGAPASMRLPDGPPPVGYYACAYEADD